MALVAIKNIANPSVDGILTPTFMALLANAPAGSEIFTTELKNVDMPSIAVEVCSNGAVQYMSVSSSSAATSFPTLVSNISGVGYANFTYSTDPNVHLASWAIKTGMITSTYKVFGVAWGVGQPTTLYLPLLVR